jgi:5-methylcytosine-specific restriction protein A
MPWAVPLACPCGWRRKAGQPCPRCGCGKRDNNRARGTRTARGYDNRWGRFAKQYLQRNPLCVFCAQRGIVTAASEVHHRRKLKDHPELKYDESNLAASCKPCHSALTRRGE